MCCGCLITSATIMLPCKEEYKMFGGVWVLNCSHALNAYCVANILDHNLFRVLISTWHPTKWGNLYRKHHVALERYIHVVPVPIPSLLFQGILIFLSTTCSPPIHMQMNCELLHPTLMGSAH